MTPDARVLLATIYFSLLTHTFCNSAAMSPLTRLQIDGILDMNELHEQEQLRSPILQI